jgi:hypothetical protein
VGQDIRVLLGDCVEASVIDTEAEDLVLLWHYDDRKAPRRSKWNDDAFFFFDFIVCFCRDAR